MGLSRTHGVVVGDVGGVVYMDDRETHTLLIAPTGSGKDTFHILPTLSWGWTQSTLVLDPKAGEVAAKTGPLREQYGDVAVFAPYRRPQACLNVLDAIRLGEPEEFRDARAIGHSLTQPEQRRTESSAGAHFRDLAETTIAAGCLHVRYTQTQASLGAVWQFLTQAGSFAEALKTMQQTAHTQHGVHQAIAEMSRMVSNIGQGDELGSAWSTTLRPLSLYLDPYVAASTDTTSLNVEALQYGPTPLSLYLTAESPTALGDMYQVYRVVLDTILAVLQRHAPKTFHHRLLFCGNELPRFGYMPALNSNAAVMRDYGIKGFYIAQDLKQLEDVYGQEPELWSNTDCKLFHATGNDRTAKRLSEGFLDKQTVEYLVTTRTGRGRSVSPHRVGQWLLTPAQMGQLDPSKLILCLRGERPVLLDKYGFRRDLYATAPRGGDASHVLPHNP